MFGCHPGNECNKNYIVVQIWHLLSKWICSSPGHKIIACIGDWAVLSVEKSHQVSNCHAPFAKCALYSFSSTCGGLTWENLGAAYDPVILHAYACGPILYNLSGSNSCYPKSN